ncbi:hypothetical protein O0L34_g15681 [Tuta absoluta]|nr:hypothetical protein O0L34_g15681 [Tuta absoluta]
MTDNRFTVSTVDGECKKNGIHMGATIITRPLRSSAEMVERGTAVVAPSKEHQGETWLHDAGWRRKRSVLAESHPHGNYGHHQASAELSRDGVDRGIGVVTPSKEHQGDTWLHDAGWRRKRSVLVGSHPHGNHDHHQASEELSRDGGARSKRGDLQQ